MSRPARETATRPSTEAGRTLLESVMPTASGGSQWPLTDAIAAVEREAASAALSSARERVGALRGYLVYAKSLSEATTLHPDPHGAWLDVHAVLAALSGEEP